MHWAPLAILFVAVLWLTWSYRRERERRRMMRGAFFAECCPLFEKWVITQDHLHYPVLAGRYQGLDIEIEPIIDDLTVRKLPSLWIKVSLKAPVRYSGIFDLLIRPRGMELYSPAFDLPFEIARPQDWPADAIIRSDDSANMPPLAVFAEHLHLFDDPKMKELLVTPKGVRLVYQAAQASRGTYAVLRQSEFAETRLAPGLAARLLQAAADIYRSVGPQKRPAVRHMELT
ncbi:MAG TPA: hypothetical protein VKV77_04860 [Methylovirgula sp.]|nr:hypothetical protein [Methylovirgula sp.]